MGKVTAYEDGELDMPESTYMRYAQRVTMRSQFDLFRERLFSNLLLLGSSSLSETQEKKTNFFLYMPSNILHFFQLRTPIIHPRACSTYLRMGRVGRKGGLGDVHGSVLRPWYCHQVIP
jgi:hypothetical protein